MALPKRSRYLAAVALAAFLPCVAFSQERGDPIGPVTKISTFDRTQQVNAGRTRSGKTVCYFREEGSSHSLDIGMAGEGAFIRLETGDSRETTPTAPLQVYAGKSIPKRVGKDEFDTGEYLVLQAFEGKVDYYIPDRQKGDFVLIARESPVAFLQMVARARTEFVVVQSVADPKTTDIVAIYKFKTSAIPVLLACAKQHI